MSQPPPEVPYGPAAGTPAPAPTPTPPGAVRAVAGNTAVKWGIRLLLPIIIRAIFRALARR